MSRDDAFLGVSGIAIVAAVVYVLHARRSSTATPLAGSTIVPAPQGQSFLDAYGDLEPALSRMRAAIQQAQQAPPNPIAHIAGSA